MRKAIWHFIIGTLVSAFLWPLVSCSHDMEDADVLPSAGEMTLNIGFKVSTRAGENENDGYEEGDTYENYIDIANGGYRIYFFDTANKLITRFEPSGFVATEGSDYRQYNVLGKAPDALVQHSAFKMVVIANWPDYDDTGLEAGITAIEDICNADWAQFDCLTNGELGPDAERLMPFFGVHEYSGVTFKAGEVTYLEKPVTLLRAMAKVEVILETDEFYDLSFSELKINRYNAKGYCAPMDVSTHGDYDHEGDSEKDYVHALHLVNGANDEAEKELKCRFVQQWNEGETRYEKWIAYLPEYQNIGADKSYSSIKAKFNIQLSGDDPHTIYFAKYSGGKTDNSDANRLNIERNNIYRFHVECTGYNFKLLLSVSDWEGLYEDSFDFGDGQIVSPVSPWENEISNDIEF